MNGNPYSCAELAQAVLIDKCQEEEDFGQIAGFAFAKKSATIDKTSVATIFTGLKAAELTCDAHIVRRAQGSTDGGNFTKEAAFGTAPSRVTKGVHIATLIHNQMPDNVKRFWNSIRDRLSNYDFYYWTTSLMFVIDKPISGMATMPVPGSREERVLGTVTIEWNDRYLPEPLRGTYEQFRAFEEDRPDLGAVTLDDLGSAATIVDMEVTQPAATPVGIGIGFATAAETYFIAPNSTLPTGLSLNADGELTGTVAAGTYNFSIVGQNACGISGSADITLILTA